MSDRQFWFDRAGNPIDVVTANALLGNIAERLVARDTVQVAGVDVDVSTVFLVLDHGFVDGMPPVLFETLVFGGPDDQWGRRYETEPQARAGHLWVLGEYEAGRLLTAEADG